MAPRVPPNTSVGVVEYIAPMKWSRELKGTADHFSLFLFSWLGWWLGDAVLPIYSYLLKAFLVALCIHQRLSRVAFLIGDHKEVYLQNCQNFEPGQNFGYWEDGDIRVILMWSQLTSSPTTSISGELLMAFTCYTFKSNQL